MIKKSFTILELIFVILIVGILVNIFNFSIIDYSLIGIRNFMYNFDTMINMNNLYSCFNIYPKKIEEKRYYNCFNHLKIYSKNGHVYYVLFNDLPNNGNFDNKINKLEELLFEKNKYFTADDFNNLIPKNKLNQTFDLSFYGINKVIIKNSKNKLIKIITTDNNQEFDILLNSNNRVFFYESNNDNFNYYKDKNYLKDFIVITFVTRTNKNYNLKLYPYGLLKFD